MAGFLCSLLKLEVRWFGKTEEVARSREAHFRCVLQWTCRGIGMLGQWRGLLANVGFVS